jgi:hypothetical protein
LRELGAGVLLLFGGFLVARVLIFAILRVCPPALVDWNSGFIGMAKDCLSRISSVSSSNEPVALFFSGSVTKLGLSEPIFAAEAGRRSVRLTPIVLGYTYATPSSQVVLARKLRDALAASGRRAEVTAVELKPDALTATFRKDHEWAIDLREAVFLEPSELLGAFFSAPGRAGSMLGMRLLGDVSPIMISNLVRATLFDYVIPGRSADSLRRKYSIPGGLIALKRVTESELDFIPLEVERFSEIVELLKSISKKTLVFIPPFDASRMTRSPGSWSRLEELKAALQTAQGVRVLDFSHAPGFEREDFVEGFHFIGAGIPKFSRLLTNGVVDAL